MTITCPWLHPLPSCQMSQSMTARDIHIDSGVPLVRCVMLSPPTNKDSAMCHAIPPPPPYSGTAVKRGSTVTVKARHPSPVQKNLFRKRLPNVSHMAIFLQCKYEWMEWSLRSHPVQRGRRSVLTGTAPCTHSAITSDATILWVATFLESSCWRPPISWWRVGESPSYPALRGGFPHQSPALQQADQAPLKTIQSWKLDFFNSKLYAQTSKQTKSCALNICRLNSLCSRYSRQSSLLLFSGGVNTMATTKVEVGGYLIQTQLNRRLKKLMLWV